ncbi:Peroxiredoxin [Fibrisoma limi BUZ 3]|uniref:Glutathione peroxidase n=1 Tax=Fibrisoma limi BUZ 3 TaxID=1185876 RepID=I2GN37_9BACT|nr:glutathione peroxidase [Fibrisoma limi]CCH55315.1 Peroxiredoxin [Fibrisoma limi BUZ 3]
MRKTTVLTLSAFGLLLITSGFMSLSTLVKGIFSDKKEVAVAPTTPPAPAKTLYDFTVKSIDGKSVSLSGFKGKKVVVLNVASKCGYTPQYGDWEKFYKEHGSKIVVLGFPANDFASQEPGSNEEIATFCQKNYGVTFPMFEKVVVTGKEQAPLYKWLSSKSLNGWNDKAPTWNFCKYVINEQGQLTHFFASGVKPDDAEFKKAVGI